MDYRGLTYVDMEVRDFIAAGLSEQQHMRPSLDKKAAYAADTPVILGFTRIIQTVWSNNIQLEIFENLPDAMAWLDPGISLDDLTLCEQGTSP